MNKDAYYFSHDSNARNDEKLLAVRMKLGAEGYGIYFMIIERLRDESDFMSIKDYNILAFDFRVSADKVKSVIEDFELFEFCENHKFFYSIRLINSMKLKSEKSEKARESANKRWNKTSENANALQTHSEGNALKERKGKESKVKESKEEEKEVDNFSSSSTQKILLSKQISIDQWAMMFKVSKERIHNCISEFSDFKSRHSENTWKNETDLTKNFEFWLRSNAIQKTVKPQTQQNGNFQKAKRR